MSSLQTIYNWVDLLVDKCSSWIHPSEDGNVYLVDPNDNVEISAHYGATHSAAALILLGYQRGDDRLIVKGQSLLNSILDRWHDSMSLPSFHNDFNNFALCLIEVALPSENAFVNRIREVVLTTDDSNHDTTNWLPMRAFVNKQRYKWTNDQQFLIKYNVCLDKIQKATNPDGGIEDRLPYGTSFNLQYDVATVAGLQLLKSSGLDKDLSREFGFLLNAVAPDGDINYQGRGANQVFAWSCWLYLLASSGEETELQRALSFLDEKLRVMLDHNNLLLNSDAGREKRLWWDYHYASVYISHLLLWLVLAERDFGLYPIKPEFNTDDSTGLKVHKGEDFFVAIFEGRKEYLAESGPIVTAIWTKGTGMVFKGSFGPWQGLFGNNHCPTESVLNNYWGPIKVNKNRDFHNCRMIRKFFPWIVNNNASSFSHPSFSGIRVKSDRTGYIDVEFDIPRGCVLNLPVFGTSDYVPQVFVDNTHVGISKDFMIQNQYGVLTVFRSSPSTAKSLTVSIPR